MYLIQLLPPRTKQYPPPAKKGLIFYCANNRLCSGTTLSGGKGYKHLGLRYCKDVIINIIINRYILSTSEQSPICQHWTVLLTPLNHEPESTRQPTEDCLVHVAATYQHWHFSDFSQNFFFSLAWIFLKTNVSDGFTLNGLNHSICLIPFLTGYGYITPQTPTGQMLCIFVSLLGIPITMLALKSVGELIAKWVNALVTKFEKRILKRPEPKRMQAKSAVILFSLMAVLIVANSILYMILTEWSLIEGVYFWFVTLTTIGFGDYVYDPGKPQRIRQLSINSTRKHENKAGTVDAGEATAFIFLDIFSTFYFILCLCVISSVLNSIMAALEEQKCRPRCPGCIPRKKRNHLDNEQNNTPEQRDTSTSYLTMENFGFQKENITALSVTDIK